MSPAFWVLWAVGIGLQIALLKKIVFGKFYRQLPVLSTYVVILFLTALVDAFVLIDIGHWKGSPAARIYWFNDTLRQCGLLAAILAQMSRISGKRGRGLRIVSIALAAIFIGIAFVYHTETGTERWTSLVRNLSFLAVICNLALWMRLLRSRLSGNADPNQLALGRLFFALSAGAGIQLAGEAVGQSVRAIALQHRSHLFINVGNYVLVLSHLLCLAVWLSALRAAQARAALPAPAAASDEEQEKPPIDDRRAASHHR